MYTAARQTSQGRQQTYSSKPVTQEPDPDFISDIDVDINVLPLMPPALTRGYSQMPCLTRSLTHGSNQRSQSLCNPPFATKDDLDSDLGMKYELSQDDTSGYTSLGVMKMMREVSYQPPMKDQMQDQDQMKDQMKDLTLDEALELNLDLP
jgi:hypothetical protein